MPMKWCPKCKELKERGSRVFSVASIWNEDEDDYRYDPEDLYNSELIDKCLECETDLEELPNAKGAEDNQAM